MDAPTLCTVCTAARLPHALALADGWRAAGGAGTPLVVVADALPGTLPAADGVRLVAGAELGIDDFDLLAGEHDARALATVLVPFALAAAGAPAVYLAPDAEVLAPIALPAAELVLAARGGEGSPVADPGFAGLPAPQPELLAWWQGRVRDAGATTAWHDVLLGRFAGVELAHDPAWAVAAWNLDERGIDASGTELTTADGAPVAWLALPGLEGAELPGVDLDARPALRAVLERRAAAVARHAGVTVPAGYAETATGLPLGDELRALARVARDERVLERSLFDPAGAAAFQDWLVEPSGEPASGGVPRLAFRLWVQRAELRVAYPDLMEESTRVGYLGWLSARGEEQLGLPPAVLPPAPPVNAESDPRAPRPARPWGVNVAGYFQSELGIGGVARGVIEALDAAHVPILPVQGSIPPPSRRGRDFGSTGAGVAPFAVNLICVNADGLPQFVRDVGEAFFSGRRSIGLWWWEVEDFPERYHGAFEHLDEVWVGSRHVQRAIAPHAPVPVVHVPVPLRVPPPPRRTRAELGVPEGFLVLVTFDFNSVLKRKNPAGAIDAFVRAFGPDSGASLVVKSVNAELHPTAHAELLRAVEPHPHVHLRDGYLDEGDVHALLAAADAYLSLHRSEGFGLGLAEAMALGTPVVATGYSGNLEFMDAETGWLVPYALVPIGPDAGPYPADGVWAEPDVEAAAAALRAIRDDPAAAAARAARAHARIHTQHAPGAAGAAMARRLEIVRRELAEAVRPPARGFRAVDLELEEARGRVGRDVTDYQRDDVGRMRRQVQGGVRRAGAPLDEARRDADAALFDALVTLTQETEASTEDVLVLYASALARARRAEDRLAVLERAVQRLDPERARTELDELMRAAHGIPYMAGEPFTLHDHPVAGRVLGFRGDGDGAAEPDAYRFFEDIFRGSEERIRGILAPYVDLLRDHGPVLDVGCGRGELLELLRDAGVEASGVDADAGMAARAQERGLEVTVGDGVEHLRGLPDGSLGAVTAMQVIEHLPPAALTALLDVARQKLRPGGLLVAETVNPHAGHALKTFWVDVTHQHPLFPESVLALVRAAGYREGFVCHLAGLRDVERDRFNESSYAVVATA